MTSTKTMDWVAQKIKKHSPEKFEIHLEKNSSIEISCKRQKTDSLIRAEDQGISLRVIKNQRMGFSYSTSLEIEALDRMIRSAFEIAECMPKDPYCDLYSFTADYPTLKTQPLDEAGLNVPLKEKIALTQEIETATLKADPRIQAVRDATFKETRSETLLLDSLGTSLRHDETFFTAKVVCRAEENGDNQMGYDFAFSHFYKPLDVSNLGKSAASRATELLGAKTPPSLHCPAIFRNDVVASLLGFLSASFFAEEIDKGQSMLIGKEGKAIFSNHVQLINDGLLEGGWDTSPFDAEGVPTQKTVLVQDGVFMRPLSNLYYFKKKGVTPTGSSKRGMMSPPSLSTTNLYLQSGQKPFETLLDGISRGILITQLMGLHTANPVTGSFSIGASGIFIENGKLTYPIKGFAIAGNILDVFRQITDISNDHRLFGGVGASSIRVKELSVGGK